MKYKLTNNKKTINGTPLYQIQALKDFGDVKNGDFGGWVETEDNLSHHGTAVVFGNAVVGGDETPTPNPDLPDILSTLPKEVTSITISGKTYKLETKWVLQD